MAQIQIKDALGAIQTAAKVDNTGQTTRSNSMPTTLSTEDLSALVPGIVQGIVNTSDTTAVTRSFTKLQCLTDVQFTALTETGATGSLAGITVKAGTILYGTFTAYALTSGTVRAYP